MRITTGAGRGEPLHRRGDAESVLQLPIDREAFAVQLVCACVVAARSGKLTEAVERLRSRFPIAELAVDAQAFLQQRAGLRVIAAVARRHAQPVQRTGDARAIAELATDRETLVVQRSRGFVIAVVAFEVAEASNRVRDVRQVAELTEDRETLVVQRSRRRVVALDHREAREMNQRHGNAPAIAELAVDRQTLLVELAGASVVALLVREKPLVVQHRTHTLAVAEFAPDRDALFIERRRRRIVALLPGQYAGPVERSRARRGGGGGSRAEELREPAAALAEIAAHEPEARDRARELEAALAVAKHRGRARQRRAQVVVLGLEPIEPRLLGAARQLWLRLVRKRKEVREVALVAGRAVGQRVQPLRRVLLNRLEQPVARRAVALVDDDEALVDERRDELDHVARIDRFAGTDPLRGFERKAPDERRYRAEQRLFGLAQAGRSSSRSQHAASAGAAAACATVPTASPGAGRAGGRCLRSTSIARVPPRARSRARCRRDVGRCSRWPRCSDPSPRNAAGEAARAPRRVVPTRNRRRPSRRRRFACPESTAMARDRSPRRESPTARGS